MKNIIKSFTRGAFTMLGWYSASKLIDVCKDPVRRTKIKNKIKNIKDEILKKD